MYIRFTHLHVAIDLGHWYYGLVGCLTLHLSSLDTLIKD
nr:MAG TPA: hypothetical protein [Crassvirales sp.]